MPELPEVETTKEGIKPHLEGQTISHVVARHNKLRLPIAATINELCKEKNIIAVLRRAKYILLKLTTGHLLIHLGMSGHLRVVPAPLIPGKHDHIDLVLKNGQALRYCDPRRFGLFLYFSEEPSKQPLLAHLGPEPLSENFNADYLYLKTREKKQLIKSIIMDNTLVVGIGNIYAAESLFLAGIHPNSLAKKLNFQQCERLTIEIKNLLHSAIKLGGTTLKDFYSADGKPGYFVNALKVYGRKNKRCFTCDTVIESEFIKGRSTCFCPQCQVLA